LENSAFTSNLMKWYAFHKRDLPWRNIDDAYKIWLAEIIMQQTRIQQGLPYYEKFIHRFPKICELANAKEDDVLRLWQGLGYYSRARNLHKCAKIICKRPGHDFPTEYTDLLKLPGIGPYTAAAISSMAFSKPHGVVDGNVQRVLARYMGISENVAERSTQKEIAKITNQLIDKNDPGGYNHAIMDLGATICTPSNPNCQACPVSDSCVAFEENLQNKLPINKKEIRRSKRFLYYWILRYDNKMIFQKRDTKNIWKGLYEFYLIEKPQKIEPEESIDDFLINLSVNDLTISEIFEYKKHVLSHQDIYSFFIILDLNLTQYEHIKLNYSYQFYSLDEILQLPKPILIDKFLREKII